MCVMNYHRLVLQNVGRDVWAANRPCLHDPILDIRAMDDNTSKQQRFPPPHSNKKNSITYPPVPTQEQARGEDGLAATVSQVRRTLANVLSQSGAINPMAHVLAARAEELGNSRRKDERIREHLTQVTPHFTLAWIVSLTQSMRRHAIGFNSRVMLGMYGNLDSWT